MLGSDCAKASSPTIREEMEETSPASTEWVGTNRTPNKREEVKNDLKVLFLGFIKQVKYGRFPLLSLFYKDRITGRPIIVLQTKVLS
jgi:hypothetical protein